MFQGEAHFGRIAGIFRCGCPKLIRRMVEAMVARGDGCVWFDCPTTNGLDYCRFYVELELVSLLNVPFCGY